MIGLSKSNIWIIGAGEMSKEYCKVLRNLGHQFTVIGRGDQNIARIKDAFDCDVFTGGIDTYLGNKPIPAAFVINTVSPDNLNSVTQKLLHYGIKQILVEKPGALSIKELDKTVRLMKEHRAKVYIGYNRRYYESVREARRMIAKDGGVTSLKFELTEWPHVIEATNHSLECKKHWFLMNSSHVVDLAFYLSSKPKTLSTFAGGKELLTWHPNASIFYGGGVTESGALFSYSADWNSPGRWSLDLLTKKRRYILRPLEQLKVQEHRSVAVNDFKLDDHYDLEFKPGLFLQTRNFLDGNHIDLKSVEDQLKDFELYYNMAEYNREL